MNETMTRSTILTIICMVFITAFQPLYANDFASHEDSLKRLARQIIMPEHDFERLALNLEFKNYFEKVLHMEGSLHYPFDSLTTISRITAPNGNFRIISWYVPLSNNQFEYFGFFQAEKSGNQYEIYPLTDRASIIEEPLYETLNHEKWYGAYYTDLIHKRYRRKDYYLLLGWRADNGLTRKRIIEPLRILGKGRPSFGRPIFRYLENRHRRIIFEYSARATMSIRYESQPLDLGKRAKDMIVFDRLAPTQSFLEGKYQFYVPETNIFDAFVFDAGKWEFIEEIDARNTRRRPIPRPTPPSE
jgi:hypothetical protein